MYSSLTRYIHTSWFSRFLHTATLIQLHWQDLLDPPAERIICVRICSHDDGMTMVPEWVHSIFIYFSDCTAFCLHCTWHWDEIPVVIEEFNLNEILVLVWNFILVSRKLKTNSIPRWKRKPCDWCTHTCMFAKLATSLFFMWHENHVCENASCRFCRVNVVWM